MAVNLPKLYDSKGNFKSLINPISLSISERITPLSTATIELPKGEKLPARAFVELFTPYGSAGMYRVRSPQDAYGDDITTAELEHAIAEVGDYLVKEKISGMKAPQAAMKTIFGHYKGKKWKLGDVTALGTAKIAVQENYTRVLDAMLSILQQKPQCMLSFDFTTSPWTVSVKKRGTTVTAEGRLSRNVSSAKVAYDDTELCTRAYYETFGKNKKGETVGTWTHKDADTIGTYGVVEREVMTSQDMTEAEITYAVDTYLNEHKEPRISVDIEAEELEQITGESRDKFVIGKLMRLALPDYGVTVEKTITGIEWDVYENSRSMRVLLAEEDDTVVTFLHDLETKGGGGAGKKQEDKWKEYRTRITQTDTYIGLYAERVDRTEKILEKAGLDLNSKGVLIYATDKANYIGSKIKAEADRISLVVTDTKSPKIKKASLLLAITNGKSSTTITSDVIDLKGIETYIKGYLSANNVDIGWLEIEHSLSVGEDAEMKGINCSRLTVEGEYGVDTEVLKVAGKTYEWKNKTVMTGVELSMSTKRQWAYWNGTAYAHTLEQQFVNNVTPKTTTIYYLGCDD